MQACAFLIPLLLEEVSRLSELLPPLHCELVYRVSTTDQRINVAESRPDPSKVEVR